MIKKINSIKNYRSFVDFEWPEGLGQFNKYNLIYGWNASGKSTFTNIFWDVCESAISEENAKFSIKTDNNDIESTNLENAPYKNKIRIFNRKFIDENFSESRTYDDLEPIYYLGKDSVENSKKLEELSSKMKEIEEIKEHISENLERKEKEKEKIFKEEARSLKDLLKSNENDGDERFNNYNRGNYEEAIMEYEYNAEHKLDDEELLELKEVIWAEEKQILDNINYSPAIIRIEDVAEKLSYSITENVIDSLKDDSELNKWIKEGVDIHKMRGSELCLFCNQDLPKNILAKYDDHFSDEYKKFVASLEETLQNFKNLKEKNNNLNFHDKAALQVNLKSNYHQQLQKIEKEMSKERINLEFLIDVIKEKIANPFKKISIPKIALNSSRIETEINNINHIIDKHNYIARNYLENKREARNKLAHNLYAKKKGVIDKLLNEIEELKKQIRANSEEQNENKKERANIESELRNMRTPADELNKELQSFMGRSDLQYEVKDTGYQLQRNGIAAKNLSEGEKNAIAFLYFLKKLYDTSTSDNTTASSPLSSLIVIIDDPVSSLDSNSLFSTFAYMKNKVKDAKQLFILTHNFTFYRQVKKWLKFEHSKSIYELRCTSANGIRNSKLLKISSLLKQYESEYHYLFDTLYRIGEESSSPYSNDLYPIPNMARRLLESFFSFKNPAYSNELNKALSEYKDFDESKKSLIIRFCHNFSHKQQFDDSGHDPNLLGEARKAVYAIFELIKHVDNEHFENVLKIIKNDT